MYLRMEAVLADMHQTRIAFVHRDQHLCDVAIDLAVGNMKRVIQSLMIGDGAQAGQSVIWIARPIGIARTFLGEFFGKSILDLERLRLGIAALVLRVEIKHRVMMASTAIEQDTGTRAVRLQVAVAGQRRRKKSLARLPCARN